MTAPFCVLAIAGSDSGGGAGIQADQRTIQAIGGHALTAVTAVTAQDTRGVAAWRAVPAPLIRAQIEVSFAGFAVGAVKVGLLPGLAAVRTVAAALARRAEVPLVVDPVLGSSSGTRFISARDAGVLRERLFPLASVVTPNWPEAAVLSRLPVGSAAQAERAGLLLARECGRPVLVKGGHGSGGVCRDCLATAGGEARWFEHPRIPTPNTHGTGCVLSSAIAAGLARGSSLVTSIRQASSFLHRALESGRAIDWGGGPGPAFSR